MSVVTEFARTYGPVPLAMPKHTQVTTTILMPHIALATFPGSFRRSGDTQSRGIVNVQKRITEIRSFVAMLPCKVSRMVKKPGIIAPMTTLRH